VARIRNIGLLSVHSTIDDLGDIGFELISDEVPVWAVFETGDLSDLRNG